MLYVTNTYTLFKPPHRYADEDRILDYVFSVMVGLCVGRVGQSRLGTVGACTAVVSALYRYETCITCITIISQ
jgi:hypothetical protein